MTKRPIRLRKWRVYAGEKDGAGMFVYARVFATKREMLEVLRMESGIAGQPGYSNRTTAAMQSFKRYPNGGRANACFGDVNFYKAAMGVGTLAHEFGHAMLAWGWRKRIKQIDGMREEELLCYTLGRMVSRFVARAYKLGLYA